MKNRLIIATSVALALCSQYATAASIADTYAAGDTLTAAKMDNIKTAVNDNNAVNATQTGDIATNTGDIAAITAASGPVDVNTTNIATNTNDLNNTTMKIFDSSINYQIPVMSAAAGTTTVTVLLSNQSSTSCDAYLAGTADTWKIGANSRGGFFILPTYTATTMPGVTSSGTAPFVTTTYTLVARSNMSADVSTSDYINLSLLRSETDPADTCNAGNIYVRGAMVDYPDGTKYYVPVKEMVVK